MELKDDFENFFITCTDINVPLFIKGRSEKHLRCLDPKPVTEEERNKEIAKYNSENPCILLIDYQKPIFDEEKGTWLCVFNRLVAEKEGVIFERRKE